jgi:Na+/melibiose symporter-like transporter
LSFPFLFNLCIGCQDASEFIQFGYYIPFVVLLQFGWAAGQIAHLAIIPELSDCQNERVHLNSIRYAFTIISNIFVYVVTYILLKYVDFKQMSRGMFDKPMEDSKFHLTQMDAPKFTILTLVVVLVGLVSLLVYHVGIREKHMLTSKQIQCQSSPSFVQEKLKWTGYLKSFRYYNVAVLYMCTRLIGNVTQVYFGLFLTDRLSLDKVS